MGSRDLHLSGGNGLTRSLGLEISLWVRMYAALFFFFCCEEWDGYCGICRRFFIGSGRLSLAI